MTERSAAVLGHQLPPLDDAVVSHTDLSKTLLDQELAHKLREISVRDQDVPSVWGGFGDGMTIGRNALEEFCSRGGDLSRYVEAYVPTVIYHLGYRVLGAPEAATLFDHLRFGPPYERWEATRLARHGALALHPVRERAIQQEVLAIAESQFG